MYGLLRPGRDLSSEGTLSAQQSLPGLPVSPAGTGQEPSTLPKCSVFASSGTPRPHPPVPKSGLMLATWAAHAVNRAGESRDTAPRYESLKTHPADRAVRTPRLEEPGLRLPSPGFSQHSGPAWTLSPPGAAVSSEGQQWAGWALWGRGPEGDTDLHTAHSTLTDGQLLCSPVRMLA